MKTYKIKITPNLAIEKTYGREDAPYTIELTTDNIEWSMEQYQRNRRALNWEILEVNEYDV
jgi:hypothetical protein